MKLVKENIISFKRKGNPYVKLGVGKIILIKKWLDKMDIINYNINDDYTIDVDDGVWLDKMNLNNFPDYIQFNKVTGYFSFTDNNITILKGMPKKVVGDFYCNMNKLTSLIGAPEYVNYSFYCGNNIKKFTEKDVRAVCKVNQYIHV